ncbi:MAG: hypothetical protein ACJAZ3_001328 [Sphingobacteriales bacterium]
MKNGLSIKLLILVGLFAFASCQTYYQKQYKVQKEVEAGNLEKAYALLDKSKKTDTGKNRMLYFMNKGALAFLIGEYQAAIDYLNQADFLIEDKEKRTETEVLALITNPMVTDYKAEDHEKVMIHYYKALAYAQTGRMEECRVEARRLNIQLNEINNKYTKKNRYNEDAFAWILIGLAYDASREYNNAFIAYRNGFNAYNNTYVELFGIEAPLQLKKDMIRTAKLSGLNNELNFYEKEFNLKYMKEPDANGTAVVIWNNGLVPVKGENSINFSIIRGEGGNLTFVNSELGLSFNFPMPSNNESGSKGLGQLEFVRVAFPKYIDRPAYFNSASFSVAGTNYNLEKAEDLGQIAHKTLEDRFLRELGNGLMRLALKKAAEYEVRQTNDNLGAAVGILNALTEKADTRNWQTLPNEMSYSRINLPEGEYTMKFSPRTGVRGATASPQNYPLQIIGGRTDFFTINTFDTYNIGY